MNSIPVKLSAAFIETELDGEAVLMVLDTGRFFALRGTAARAWRLIDGTRDCDAILAALQAEYAGTAEAIGRDLKAFLTDLREAGLVA